MQQNISSLRIHLIFEIVKCVRIKQSFLETNKICIDTPEKNVLSWWKPLNIVFTSRVPHLGVQVFKN